MTAGRPLVKGLAHVGVAVSDLAYMLNLLHELGYEVVQRKEIAGQGVSHVVGNGSSQFDVLSPTNADGQLAKFIERRGPGMHHVCLEVHDLDRALAAADRLKLRRASPKVIEDDDGRLVFLHPGDTQGVLLGLVEPKRK